jgi:hypothetical protein
MTLGDLCQRFLDIRFRIHTIELCRLNDAEGGKVRLVARRHQVSESLLYIWRSARKAAAVAMGASENVEFTPVGVIEGHAPRGPVMLALQTPEPAPQSLSAEAKPD